MTKIVRCLPLIGMLGVWAFASAGSPSHAAPRRARSVTHGWTVGKIEPLLPIVGTNPTGGGSVVGPCTPVPGCACAEVQVRCGDPGGDQYAGETEGCTITLDPAVCSSLGIVPVASTIERIDYVPINPACWLDPINAIPNFTGIGQIEAYCTAQHEALHACADTNIDQRCAKEHNAYGQTLACLNRIWDAKCNELGPGNAASYCHDLQVTIGVDQGLSALEQCLCQTSLTCEQCVAHCQSAAGSFTDFDDHETIVANCEGYGYEHACAEDERP